MQPKYFESLYPVDSWDKEIEQIVNFVKEGGSTQLIGLPGSGRSNIFGLLTNNREVRLRHFPKNHGIVHFVLVNFSEVRKRPYVDVVKYLFLSLDNSLREREMQEEYAKIDGLFKKALSYNDELVLSQELKNAIEYLAIERKLTIIFLLDRFDDYIPQVIDDFFTLLRSLRDRAKYRFSVIFSLNRPLEDTLEPDLYTDFSDFIAGHHVYMALFDKPSIEFRISYLEKLTGKKLTDKQKQEIIMLTGGHTRLVKVATEALVASSDDVDNLKTFLIEQPTVRAALTSIWKSLTLEEQSDLLRKEYTGKGYLVNGGLIQDKSVTIKLFELAIESRFFTGNNAKLLYDEATNTIKWGEVTLSDSLTKAEFRLLRYLIQHPEEVVDRETIIATVWREDVTTAGVTDQAIDQLIFRLRRKIEEDPNKPQHLQTIKGRGLKFAP